MKNEVFYFEIRDAMSEFARAFNDIIISRYNKEREVDSKIPVRLSYSPKKAYIYDITNKAKNRTLPAIAFNFTTVSRDKTRIFSKNNILEYRDKTGSIKCIGAPIPININISLSIITTYQMDMDQIISNFVVNANPYIYVSTLVPLVFDLSSPQELRHQIIWDETFSIQNDTTLDADKKDVIVADTSFVFKTWIFPKNSTSGPINVIYDTMSDSLEYLESGSIITIDDNSTVKVDLPIQTLSS